MANEPEVTVRVKLLERGQLRAFADVTIAFSSHELTLLGYRIVQKDGQPPWIALPSSSYQKEGKPVNKKLVECSRKLNQTIQEAILLEYELARSTGPERAA
jgi:DNA-binding cell septation regulator SpoVG